ncbi:hypothetical protein [Streptomyces megasporus]|uniref:hypothetical protein n=1 Tax=Streptomyces megasporus TaxID=44060 RepID=UPI0004E15CA1|nr:hypothetical protein [Streptomyces megasporus]
MHVKGAETQAQQYRRRGHVLLIAGDRATHRRRPQITPSANLAALATVPTPVLLGSDLPTDLVHLDGVHDPNSVLLRLRAAVAASGPVLLYLSGRLTADRRRHELHLALTGTTTGAVRYTALPWSWLRNELRPRPSGTTAVFVDLAADKHAWAQLQDRPDALGEHLPVCGVVLPPGLAGTEGVSPYTRHLVEQLHRQPARPGNAHLHATTVAVAGLPPGTLVLPRTGQLTITPEAVASGTGDRDHATPAGQPQALRQPVPPRPEAAPRPVTEAGASGGTDRPPTSTTSLPAVPQQSTVPEADPRPVIWEAAQAGRHNEAAAMAAAWEQHAMRRHGPNSAEATHWAEIRADLARIAENYPLATRLWIAAARSRLALQTHDAPEVLAAAQGAHYCWHHVTDQGTARELGPELLALLRQLPALDPRHVPVAQRRLNSLNSRTSAAG